MVGVRSDHDDGGQAPAPGMIVTDHVTVTVTVTNPHVS